MIRRAGGYLGLALGALLALAPALPCRADDAEYHRRAKPQRLIADYGDVMPLRNPESDNFLYIVSQVHRHPVTGKNVEGVPEVQTEVYRIVEHLLKKRNVHLLLQEGLDFETDYYESQREWINGERRGLRKEGKLKSALRHMDESDEYVRELLSSDENRLAAMHLVKLRYPKLDLQGITNEEMKKTRMRFAGESQHKRLRDYIDELASCRALIEALRKAEEEFLKGRMQNKNAILIIGDGHRDEMERFVKADRCEIAPVPEYGILDLNQDLEFDEKGYGVVLIVPNRILAQPSQPVEATPQKPE